VQEYWKECIKGNIFGTVHLVNIEPSLKIIKSVNNCVANNGIGVVVVMSLANKPK